MFRALDNSSSQQNSNRISTNNNINSCRNPYKIKRTYNNSIFCQDNDIPNYGCFGKKLKQREQGQVESFIKKSKPKIPEHLLREIEKYRIQSYAYNYKINLCPCENEK